MPTTEPDYRYVTWDEQTLEVRYGGVLIGRLEVYRPGHSWRFGQETGAIAYTLRGAATELVRAHLNKQGA